MLHAFLSANKAELIERCRSRVVHRRAPKATDAKLESGIPLFIEQLIETLEIEQTPGGASSVSKTGETAARHGRELLQNGFTIAEVVHDYCDLRQTITEVAVEHAATIGVEEFRTLNRCLDDAIAEAVTEFGRQRDIAVAQDGVEALNQRLGFLSHELRNFIHTATLSLAAMRTGFVGLGGATGGVLDRSLAGMRALIDRTLADVRHTAGFAARYELISVADFIDEVKLNASLEAKVRECGFSVAAVDPELLIDADPDTLFSAVGNLLQNAFKFTHLHTNVSLKAYASGDLVLIDVEDHCGGLSGDAEKMFEPFAQSSKDRSGFGLGLAICRRGVEANNGILSVRSVPGSGCVFTVDLPRRALPKVVSEEARIAP